MESKQSMCNVLTMLTRQAQVSLSCALQVVVGLEQLLFVNVTQDITVSGREVCQSKQRKLFNTLFRFSPVSQYKVKPLIIIVRLFLNLLFVKYVLLLIVLNARLVLTLQPVLKLNRLLLVLKLNHLLHVLKLNHLLLVLKLNHLLLVLKLNHLLLVLKLNHLLLVLKLNHLLLVLILKHVLNALQILIVQPLMIQLGLRVIPPLNVLIHQHWCQ